MQELLNIRNRLVNNHIDYSQALELLKELPKPYKTDYWKNKRKSIIKEKCEFCDNSKDILAIVSFNLPRKFFDIHREIMENYYHQFIEQFQLLEDDKKEIIVNEEEYNIFLNQFEQRDVCPKCFRQIGRKFRKNMSPKYRCSVCYHEFDKPSTILYNPKIRERINNLNPVKYLQEVKLQKLIQSKWKGHYELNKQKIGKEAVLISIEESIDYRNLKNTKTMCKKCAYVFHKKDMVLCKECKKDYHHVCYFLCYKCNNLS